MISLLSRGMLWLGLLLLINGCSQLPDQTSAAEADPAALAQHEVANQRYFDLVAEIEQRPDPARLKTLREHYVTTSFYQPYFMAERTLSSSMFEAIANKDWPDCLQQADRLLRHNYISLNAHYGAMVCQFESGQPEKGEYHQEVLDSLMAAIWESGDGKSPETAFFCTSTTELYAFVQLHGFDVKGQGLIWHNEKPYDRMIIHNPRDGHEFDWFFDISAQMAKGFSVPEL